MTLLAQNKLRQLRMKKWTKLNLIKKKIRRNKKVKRLKYKNKKKLM